MDWDGIGTAAFFLSSGAVTIGIVMLKAYGLRLQHRLEQDKLAAGQGEESELSETLLSLQDQMARLNDRMDFNERLLEKPEEREVESPS